MAKSAPIQASPLDKVRKEIETGNVQLAWDLEEEDKALQYEILLLLKRLVGETSPNSKLAYKICQHMEADELEIPGLTDVFPVSRKNFNAAQKAAVKKRKDLSDKIKAANTEQRLVRAGLRKAPKGSNPDLETILSLNEAEIRALERDLEALNKNAEYKEKYPSRIKYTSAHRATKEDWDVLKEFLDKKTKRRPVGLGNNLLRNAQTLCDHLKFGTAERDVLKVILASEEDDNFTSMLNNLFAGRQQNAHTVLSKMIGVSRDQIAEMFRPTAPLIEKGLLVPVSEVVTGGSGDTADRGGSDMLPSITNYLVCVLREPDLTLDAMLKQFIGEPATTHLDWDRDFSYLGESGSEMIRMLAGAKETGVPGVNVLLYGLPGTGKTEAIKAAAKKVGLELYVVGEREKFGKTPTRNDRFAAAILAQELLADNKNAAVMLDEMEDLFPTKMSLSDIFSGGEEQPEHDMGDKDPSGVSKVFLNRFLERNKTITFWAANKPEGFDPAFRRRILTSIEFKIPPAAVREKIWENVSARHDFALSAEDRRALAGNFVVAPGLMDNAIRHAKLSGGGMDSIRGNLRAASGLIFRNRRAIEAREEVSAHYDLRFLNTTVEASEFDLRSLGENIKESGRRDFSMLLYGPAGTGKTEYFAYLARLLNMDVMLKDAASLTDKYVGETEKKIDRAFAEAEERGAFLVIDEADTFLRRRDDLGSNYEVSAVNMMLTSMQRHTQPFGCTTNLFQNIDPAAKRRFLFKVAFDYLTPDQTKEAYETFFQRDCPRSIATCPKLTPSDFVSVKKQASFITGEMTDERFIRLLTMEAKSRLDTGSLYVGGEKKLGFGAN